MVALARLEGPLRGAVHRLKYGDRPQMAAPIIQATLDRRRVGPGLIVPVPLHPSRRRRRGYNQAELLADHLARLTGGEVLRGLARIGAGGRQVGRGGAQRREALTGNFAWVASRSPASVVIVDDVVTTGSTLLECALAAQRGGVERVDALAVALG
jgi:ComF family protein